MNFDQYKSHIHIPKPQSRKGDNGKLLIIGGSSLFHAASAWSLDIASRMVDMVFYSSLPENNELIKEAKKKFWDGVVVPRGEVKAYLEEADCVLIGPGMVRDFETETLTNELLKSYPAKKWVVDAEALQMADASLFTSSMIVTPHHQEYARVFGHEPSHNDDVMMTSKTHNNVLIVLKGHEDVISDGRVLEVVQGGNG
jgi:NAD(P)H-hydrate epimerase